MRSRMQVPAAAAAPAPSRLQASRLALSLLSLGIVVVFLAAMLLSTQGHFVPQVTDLYLVCQYARALAEGHPFQYNAGEPYSTGATSPLHMALLALAHALGARGEGLVAFAILSGALFYMAGVRLACHLGATLAGEREGLLAGGLVALGGPVVWGFLYGSDIAMVMFLCLWLLDRMVHGWGQPGSLGVVWPSALIALARPEGLVIAVAIAVAWGFRPGPRPKSTRRLLLWLPPALGLGVLVLYRSLTGSWLGTSVTDKSIFASYGPVEGLALVCEYGVDVVRGLLLGFYPAMAPIGLFRGWAPFFFPPLGLVFILLLAARPPAAFAAPLRLWLALVALLFAALAPNTFMGAHYQRYLMWAFPTLHVLIAVGLGRMAGGPEGIRPRLDRAAFAAAAALFLGLGLVSTLRFAAAYGSAAGEVYHRDVALAEWMKRHLPPGATVASVATSVEYLTGHRNLNLHGVTSPAFFGARASEREAASFETLGRLPAGERPSLIITSDSVQQALPIMPYLVAGPPLFRTASFSSDELLIHTMRYDFPGRNGRLFLPETLAALAGRQEVDRLNVCDPADERAHEYDFRARLGHLLLHGTARISAYELPQEGEPLMVIDGGRAILGWERFRIRARPGRELLVVLRTAPEIGAGVMRASGSGVYTVTFAEAALALRIDGQDAGRSAFRPGRGWHEQVLRVPGTLVQRERPELTISGSYASFYYWFYQ